MSLAVEPAVEAAVRVPETPEHGPGPVSDLPDLGIPVRRIDFDELLADLPKYFAAGGNTVFSHFLVALSTVFPPGEDFFVRSVRHYRADITDPVLAEQVRDFIGQEAIHGQEHRALNQRLDALGYRTRAVERHVDGRLRQMTDEHHPMDNLAITAAIEHFTAVLGEALLDDPELRALFDHDGLAQVFLWHALEECEHKSVAFDVYRHVGGNERARRRIMNQVTAGFILTILWWTMASVARDGGFRRPIRFARDLRATLASPLFQRRIWRRLRAYNRPDFHPTDIDTDGLVRTYRRVLFGDEGSLARHLTSIRS